MNQIETIKREVDPVSRLIDGKLFIREDGVDAMLQKALQPPMDIEGLINWLYEENKILGKVGPADDFHRHATVIRVDQLIEKIKTLSPKPEDPPESGEWAEIQHILNHPPTWTDGNPKTQVERIMDVIRQSFIPKKELKRRLDKDPLWENWLRQELTTLIHSEAKVTRSKL